MKRFLPLIIIVLVCGFGGYALMSSRAALAKKETKQEVATVERGDLAIKVIETGTVDAVKAVEVKSRVSGRLARLPFQEGHFVRAGEIVAIIDPQETQFKLDQDTAQLEGAAKGAERAALEVRQRADAARADYEQALARVAQARADAQTQPVMTSTAIASAEAALRLARDARQQLQQVTQPNERTSVDTEVRDAQIGYDNAQSELQRRQSLIEAGAVARNTIEAARQALESARARLERARDRQTRLAGQQEIERRQADERVRQAESDLRRAQAGSSANAMKQDELRAAIAAAERAKVALRDSESLAKARDQARATVRQLQSVVKDSRRQLHETQVKSPLEGMITKRYIEEGEMVTGLSAFTNGTPILRVEDRRTMMVKLNINEIDVARLKTGMPATVEVDALPGMTLTGQIHKISPTSIAVQQQAATADTVVKYEVEIWLENPPSELRSGMSARCTVTPSERKGVLYLPIEFVGRDPEGPFVILAGADGKPGEKKKVTTGMSTGSRIEILSGVSQGQAVAKPPYNGPERKGMMQMGDEG
jgi:HlyD family secretion protein